MSAYNHEHFDAYVESGEDERELGTFPNMLHAGERAPDGELTRFEVRRRDSAVFGAGLGRNGPRAVSEFARAEEIWAARARAARRVAGS